MYYYTNNSTSVEAYRRLQGNCLAWLNMQFTNGQYYQVLRSNYPRCVKCIQLGRMEPNKEVCGDDLYIEFLSCACRQRGMGQATHRFPAPRWYPPQTTLFWNPREGDGETYKIELNARVMIPTRRTKSIIEIEKTTGMMTTDMRETFEMSCLLKTQRRVKFHGYTRV